MERIGDDKVSQLDDMIKDSNKRFSNMIIKVVLHNIKLEGTKVSLNFYSEDTKSFYSKYLDIDETKGIIDFNRIMNSLGSYKDNYEKWLNKLIFFEFPIEISINSTGYIRYVKALSKENKEFIRKALFLDTIEGLDEDDYIDLLTNYTLKELKAVWWA